MTRILFLIDSIWGAGGAETSLLRLVQNLPADRYQCRVITFHSDAGADSFLARFPCPVEHWPMRSLYHASTLGILRRLRSLVRREKFDVVHTFFPASDLLFGPIAKLSGARVLISSRRDMGIVRKRWHHRAYRLMGRFYDQVQTVSDTVRNYAIATDGLDPNRVVTVHNGIDAAFARAAVRAQSEHPRVTLVANIRRVKGVDVFLRAVAVVKERYPDAVFNIAGMFAADGEHSDYAEEILALRHSLGLDAQVKFLGSCEDVPQLLASTDVFTLTSRSEGFSNALLEAMVCGLPCVVTAVGGNREVMEDGVHGFVVEPDDPQAVADRVLCLLGDSALGQRLGEAARRRVLDEFTIDAMVKRVAATYDGLLNVAADAKIEPILSEIQAK